MIRVFVCRMLEIVRSECVRAESKCKDVAPSLVIYPARVLLDEWCSGDNRLKRLELRSDAV